MLEWSPLMPTEPPENYCSALVLWEGTLVCDKADFESTFKEIGLTEHDVSFLGCVSTRSGRTDAFFWIRNSDVPKFALRRFRVGALGLGNIRWWSDVYYNNQQGNYPEEFRAAFPEDRE